MSKEEILGIIEKDLRFKGSLRIAFGTIFLLPGLLILAVMLDTWIEVPNGDVIGLLELQIYFSVSTIPGILIVRSGLRKRKPRNNKVYSSYADNPEKIVWIYEKFSNVNDRNLFNVILCDDSGKCYEIQSSMNEYRTLANSIKAHCPNAVLGFKEEWRFIYKKNSKDFKAKILSGSI